MAFPKAKNSLKIDSKACGGCLSCMMACSLAHEGEVNLALSRIKIIRNIFDNYPADINIAICRQCAKPACVSACPTGACYIDEVLGNIRVIDTSKCDGCRKCIEACPFSPHMIVWDEVRNVPVKCDLCTNAPYWDNKGTVACVEVCPVKAIKLVSPATSGVTPEGT